MSTKVLGSLKITPTGELFTHGNQRHEAPGEVLVLMLMPEGGLDLCRALVNFTH